MRKELNAVIRKYTKQKARIVVKSVLTMTFNVTTKQWNYRYQKKRSRLP
jgi:hypothetical protein